MASRLTHLDENGAARMVNVGDKSDTKRIAIAEARVDMKPATLKLVIGGGLKKGDALSVARVAGIMAAKNTASLIPLCHNIPLNSVEIEFTPNKKTSSILITAKADTTGKTGVEMEALTAASVAALTIYDMAKAVDKGMTITGVRLMEKSGGKSGHYVRDIKAKKP